ncbi:MAG: hypothetical protein IKP02_07495 [Paludibacteraceae bacterium]|nr:hypothetical protein [Paludibacteraceae bacterium]
MKTKRGTSAWGVIAFLSFLTMTVGFFMYNANIIFTSLLIFFASATIALCKGLNKSDKDGINYPPIWLGA